MNLRKIWLIAKREYLYNFRRRSFLFTAFGVPLITIIITGVVIALVAQSMEDISAFKHVGIVDQAQILTDSNGKPLVEIPPPFQLVDAEKQAEADLKNGTLDGYYVLPPDFKKTGHINAYNRPSLALSDAVQMRLTPIITRALAKQVGDPLLVDRVQDPLGKLSIYRVGNPQKVGELALVASFFVPFILAMLIFMSTTTTSQFLMSGLADEKENRMMELFITSARPTEILWGKILGLGALGLTQMLVWGVIGFGFLATRVNIDLGQTLANLEITPGYLLMLLAYFILSYLTYSAIMFGIGASANAEQESRQFGGLLSIVALFPLMLSFTYFIDPNGPLPVFMSLFPFMSPVGMILRYAWGDVSTGEILLSLGLLVLTVMALIWLAARIFRMGLLNYGKRLTPRDIIRSLREGRQTVVIQHKEAMP